MKTLSRRSVTTGLAAAVASLPGLVVANRSISARERVDHHTRELEKAMGDLYGTKRVTVLTSEPDEGCNPHVFVCAKVN